MEMFCNASVLARLDDLSFDGCSSCLQHQHSAAAQINVNIGAFLKLFIYIFVLEDDRQVRRAGMFTLPLPSCKLLVSTTKKLGY